MAILEAAPGTPRTGGYQITLTGVESSRAGALAERLVRTPPGLLDDPDWLRHVRQLSCHLPVSLLEAIRRYRHEPGDDGLLLISGLPIEEDVLPDTPGVWGSVESAATVPAALALLIGLQLGEVVAYRAEKNGALVQNVLPVRGMEASQSNAGSWPLDFHVENAFHAHRPDYLGLLCLRSDHDGMASTLVSSIRRVLPALSESDRDILHQPRFVTQMPPSFTSGTHSEPHSVFDGSGQDPNIILDCQATTPLDDEAKDALERLSAALAEAAAPVVLKPGQMVFVDNRIVLHGRSLFTPRYDGRDRWLHRVYVTLDHRRNRSHRPGNGAVLV
jgi:L-asparagine oxygenase